MMVFKANSRMERLDLAEIEQQHLKVDGYTDEGAKTKLYPWQVADWLSKDRYFVPELKR